MSPMIETRIGNKAMPASKPGFLRLAREFRISRGLLRLPMSWSAIQKPTVEMGGSVCKAPKDDTTRGGVVSVLNCGLGRSARGFSGVLKNLRSVP
jgi:hypothetical protein